MTTNDAASASSGPDAQAVACVLALVEVGAVSAFGVSAWIDGEIAAREGTPLWLLDASLARSLEDKLHNLRLVAGATAAAQDPLLLLEAALLGLDRRRVSPEQLARMAFHLPLDHDLPSDLRDALYELDEDVTCAHAFGGVSQPHRVAESIAAVKACLAKYGKWRTRLAQICAAHRETLDAGDRNTID